jgi:creatinine amidohydrolase
MRMYGLPDFEANSPGFDGDGKATGDHAGKVETSLLWALEPECVDVSRFPPAAAPGPHFAMGPNARQADRRVGERMVADEVRWLGNKASELLDAYEKEKPAQRRRLTFMDIERIWADEVLPQLKDFRSMQYGDNQPPAENSIWQLNYRIPDEI